MRAILGSLAALAWIAGCGPDLPDGWEGAERVSLVQSECTGDAYDESVVGSLQASARPGGIDLAYRNAHFRCEQKVEGFLRRDGDKLDLLLQPEDMDPWSVAKCDCLYEISASVDADPGAYDVGAWHRWDNLNEPNDPELVATAKVMVN